MLGYRRPMARPLDPDTRRGEILDCAFQLFARVGFRDVTMRDVAREIGASTGAVYHWFASKEALWTAVVERQSLRLITEAVAALPKGSAAARLGALADWVDLRETDLQAVLRVALDYQHQSEAGRELLSDTVRGLRTAVAVQIPQPPMEATRTLTLIFGALAMRTLDPSSPRMRTLLGSA